MAEDKILQIFRSILGAHTQNMTIGSTSWKHIDKYAIAAGDFYIRIEHDTAENSYSVYLEIRKDDVKQSSKWLTGCALFRKAMKRSLRKQKLKWDSLENHMICLATMIKERLDTDHDLTRFAQEFETDRTHNNFFL